MRSVLAVVFLSMAFAGCGVSVPATDVPVAIASPSTNPQPSASMTPSPSAATSPTTPAPTASIAPAPSPESSPEPTPNPTANPTPKPTPKPTPTPTGPTFAELVGQKLVVRMSGTTPSTGLLERIRLGQIGGVILFGENVATPSQVRALTTALQAAARAGGRPPLLIGVDQEGGDVARIPWAPPTLSPPEIGAQGSATVAHEQGAATGAALLDLGINCDFAPVADVPASTSSFMEQEGRTWSSDAGVTTTMAIGFARGLRSAGVVPVLKHFPGIGYATLNTDVHVVTLTEPATAFDPGLQPYEAAVARDLPMVMLSNATYSAFDADNAAGWSSAIAGGLLRDELGFRGVTITDSLSGTAKVRGVPTATLAIAAASAGTDMILVTGPEDATARIYDELVAAAHAGTIARSKLRASYTRIVGLKADFAGGG